MAGLPGRRLGACIAIVSMAFLAACKEPPTGHLGFASPLADPIALSPDGRELYVVNTPADTLDVIDTRLRRVVQRIPTGIDPVGVAVRPDGKEVWVSNHVSDTVSVIDVDRDSPSRHHVIGTVTAWAEGYATDFDEPVGIAFASDEKAYVALSSRNRIAVVDVPSRQVVKQFPVYSQDPRAIAVRDGRLYVIPFESGNQTELSGCFPVGGIYPEGCTFNILDLGDNGVDDILTRFLPADITRRSDIPDRDLFVYDTADESPLEEVWTLGTLLYGLAIDSRGRVFVALTEARNDANGGSFTSGDDLPEMENRAFLNQIARVDCEAGCSDVEIIDLEPLPPEHPAPGTALATPYGIQVSADDRTVVAVAAASNRLFTLDADSGVVLGTAEVGAIPRGLALESDDQGRAHRAWVLNAVENSVSLVELALPHAPFERRRIPLDDPTHPEVKRGRIAFNDARGSTTETFSCASCHPDGNTDQLLWNLGARCITPGCDQTQPRSTMPVRGLRDTLPLHWDGVVGDPFGGVNAILADSGEVADPTCDDEHSCFRDLVDGAMSGTMCEQGNCPADENELGLAGAFDEAARDAMAVFLRSVPYPPARERRLDDRFTELGAEGFRDFLIGPDPAHPGCSRVGVCHTLPFWAGTNTPGSGMDAPTFRGIPDRTLMTPNGRQTLWEVLRIPVLNEVAWDPNKGYDELHVWGVGFGTEILPQTNRLSLGKSGFSLFQLFLEGATGFSATFGRQVTLDDETTQGTAAAETLAILTRLEQAASDRVIDLRAEGLRLVEEVDDCPRGLFGWLFGRRPECAPWLRWRRPERRHGSEEIRLAYRGGRYRPADFRQPSYDSEELVEAARAGELLVTVTGRMGPKASVEHPQPGLWLPARHPQNFFSLAALPEVEAGSGSASLTFFARHLAADPIVLVDGRRVEATVSCAQGGAMPDCEAEQIRVDLAGLPEAGDHTIQLGNPRGLISNEVLLIVHP